MYTYYISVGSNMGDKKGYIYSAFQSLQQHEAVSKVISSTLIETEPWGYTEQDTLGASHARFRYYFSLRLTRCYAIFE